MTKAVISSAAISLRARLGLQGNSRFTWINEKPVTSTDSGGALPIHHGRKSYSIGGDFLQSCLEPSRCGARRLFSIVPNRDSQQGPVPRHQPTRGLRHIHDRHPRRLKSAPTSTSTIISIPPPRCDLRRDAACEHQPPEASDRRLQGYFGVGVEYVTLLRSTRPMT